MLEYHKIQKNPGRKALAKLMLNSFWGKFGERQNKPTTHTVGQPQKLFNLLTDLTLEVSTVCLCTEDVLELLGTFKALFLLGRTEEQVLYYDTDLVIYRWCEGQSSIPLGNYLGDMTDELDGETITEFVAGGAKNYGYRTTGGKMECKVRGFTLNSRGKEVLNFNSMKANILNELVDPQDDKRTIRVKNPNHFARDNEAKKIKLMEQVKRYGLVFDKRVVDTVTKVSHPYGYKRTLSVDEGDEMLDPELLGELFSEFPIDVDGEESPTAEDELLVDLLCEL